MRKIDGGWEINEELLTAPLISELVSKLLDDRKTYEITSTYVCPVFTLFCRSLLLATSRGSTGQKQYLSSFVLCFSIYRYTFIA